EPPDRTDLVVACGVMQDAVLFCAASPSRRTSAMAGPLLPDDLWDEIADLFPSPELSPDGGRHPIEPRVVMTAILFVLKTGIGWEDLPAAAVGVSDKTRKLPLHDLRGAGR